MQPVRRKRWLFYNIEITNIWPWHDIDMLPSSNWTFQLLRWFCTPISQVNDIANLVTMQCSTGMPLDTHHPPKHLCRPSTPPHGNRVPRWQDSALCHTTKTAQKWPEEHDKELKAFPGLQILQTPIWSSIEGMCRYPRVTQDPCQGSLRPDLALIWWGMDTGLLWCLAPGRWSHHVCYEVLQML